MCEPLDLVHKGSHEQNAASGRFQQVRRVRRVSDLFRIKTVTCVAYPDLEKLRGATERDKDVFGLVPLIAVNHGICYGLANGHINAKSDFVAKPQLVEKLGGCRGGPIN